VWPASTASDNEQGRPASARYVGAYDVTSTEGIGWPTAAQLEVYEQDGMLRGQFPFPMHPGDELAFDMVPAGRDLFNPGLFHDGELFNIEMGVIFDFGEMDDDRAVGVSMRSANGFFLGEGPRAR
jgi:hypothetical protein